MMTEASSLPSIPSGFAHIPFSPSLRLFMTCPVPSSWRIPSLFLLINPFNIVYLLYYVPRALHELVTFGSMIFPWYTPYPPLHPYTVHSLHTQPISHWNTCTYLCPSS